MVLTMTSVLYLLRSPSRVPPALYQNLGSALVISVEDMSLLPKPGKVVTAPPECGLKAGESLSYKELIGLLVECGKVVTL